MALTFLKSRWSEGVSLRPYGVMPRRTVTSRRAPVGHWDLPHKAEEKSSTPEKLRDRVCVRVQATFRDACQRGREVSTNYATTTPHQPVGTPYGTSPAPSKTQSLWLPDIRGSQKILCLKALSPGAEESDGTQE